MAVCSEHFFILLLFIKSDYEVFFFSFCLPSVFQTEHPFKSKKMVWHKLLSKQRRRAVVACFRMTPLYNIPRWGSRQNRNILHGCSRNKHDRRMKIVFCFALQAPSFKHVPRGIQAQLASLWGLLFWRQDDRRFICECYLVSVWSQNVFSWMSLLFLSLCMPESNGAGRMRWRGGERIKARSAPPAYSSF